jgi:hypothetical protein
MKKLIPVFLVLAVLVISSCQKDDDQSKLSLLTTPTWASDSLLVNGVDASGAGQLLADFKGEMKFNRDGTGTFGTYTGTWRFSQNQTQLVIQSPDLAFPLSTMIHLLTEQDLKLSTSFPDLSNPSNPPMQIRLTFKAR